MQIRNFREYVEKFTVGVRQFRSYWGARFSGVIFGLFGDAYAEGSRASFFSGIVGHPEQAPDALIQKGLDVNLWRFRGEPLSKFADRVQNAWQDAEQHGTVIGLLDIVTLWGTYLYGPDFGAILTERSPNDYTATLELFGIDEFDQAKYGDDDLLYGSPVLFYGYSPASDAIEIVRLINERKRGTVSIIVTIGNSSILVP